MFYSETLLSKTGPLARVWLSANLERKLRKPDILQSNIETSVNAIVDQGQAPLALRLSGQLLLGVVRIYSRKAHYLFEDCNEAIMKIRLAFRPGNVDLPAQAHTANAASLVLPDVLTELDLLAPIPDASLLFGDDLEETRTGPDPTLLNFGSSQRLPSTYDRARRASTEPTGLLPDLDLNLDIGEDTLAMRSPSIEEGRRAPKQRTIAEEMADTSALYNGPDLDLDLGDSALAGPQQAAAALDRIGEIDDALMGGLEDDLGFPALENDIEPMSAHAASRRLRTSASPNPSELDPEAVHQPGETTFHPEDEESVHHAQRAKRRKVLQADVETEMHSADIRALQNDRSKILKPTIFLPKDPVLLALMQMQRNGSFVSSILGDGRQRGLAPELRGILSLEVVRKSAELKRKRDAGTLPTPSPEPEEEIRVPAGEDEEMHRPGAAFDFGGDTTLGLGPDQAFAGAEEETGIVLPNEDDAIQADDAQGFPHDNFDDTVAPILHPADSGPISLGTKHAVHLLRERFGPDAASTSTPSKRTKASVLFQDMLPEQTTTRAEATKMFFEVLVLATKDAIKVEQEEGVLGGPLRVRGKRGLWGSWAEERTGGTQEDAAVAVL